MFSVIKRFKGQGVYSRMKYLADYSSDIENLPTSENKGAQGDSELSVNAKCSAGSQCCVLEDSSVWILNNQNEWVKLQPSQSDDSSEATSAEVLALFGWSAEEE